MKIAIIAFISIFSIVTALAFILLFTYMNIVNTEVSLRNRYEAQYNVVETSIDKARKVIINKYKVTKEYADTFIKVVAAQSKGREGGGVFKMNAESNTLGIDSKLYLEMSNSISGEIAEIKRSQDTLTDIWREHKTFCESLPNSLLLASKVLKKPEMISSETTKEAMNSKKLNDNFF